MITAPPRDESASPASNASEAEPLLTCPLCLNDYPESFFRWRNKAAGVRHRNCKNCYNDYRRERLLPRRRLNDMSKFCTALASKERRDDMRLLAAVARQMLKRFGGLDRMCAQWAQHVMAAAERRPGHRLILKTFQAIAHLVAAVGAAERAEQESELRAAQQNAAAMTSDELAELLRTLADEPPAAVIDVN